MLQGEFVKYVYLSSGGFCVSSDVLLDSITRQLLLKGRGSPSLLILISLYVSTDGVRHQYSWYSTQHNYHTYKNSTNKIKYSYTSPSICFRVFWQQFHWPMYCQLLAT